METLRTLTYNLQRSSTVLVGLLNDRCTAEDIDILLLQEPPLTIDTNNRWTILYPSINLPSRKHTRAARSVILISHRLEPSSYNQILAPNSRDVVCVDLQLASNSIRLISCYNPCRSSLSIPTIEPVLSLPFHINLLHLSGDFNAHHTNWDPRWTTSPTRHAVTVADCFTSNGLAFLLPIGTVTQHQGAGGFCLDLVVGNAETRERTIQCKVELELDNGSDHLPILTVLSLSPIQKPTKLRRNFRKVDALTLLAAYDTHSTFDIDELLASTADIDLEADALTQDIQQAITTAVPLSRPSSHAVPWWSTTLDQLVKTARKARTYHFSHPNDAAARLESKFATALKKASIAEAKAANWREKLEGVDANSLWSTVKSIGS